MNLVFLGILLFFPFISFSSENTLSIDYRDASRKSIDLGAKLDSCRELYSKSDKPLTEEMRNEFDFQFVKAFGLKNIVTKRGERLSESFDQAAGNEQLLQGIKGTIGVYEKDVTRLEQAVQALQETIEKL